MDRRYHKIAAFLMACFCLGSAAQAKVLGAIVPHHLVASSMITSVFEGLQNEAYETVIILAPNHKNIGPHLISTSDRDLTKRIDQVEFDDRYIDQEHAIFYLEPFIVKYFPKAKIVPVIFKFYVTSEQAGKVGEHLTKVADDKTLVIASVDFSHHVTKENALANDQKSIKVISDFDLDKVYELELDSRPSIYCLLTYLQKKNAKYAKFIKNANAADFISYTDPKDLTSYVTFYFMDTSKLVTILATGDVMLGRSVNTTMERLADYKYPFRGMASQLRNADIAFINLEGPMVADPFPTNEGYKISASGKAVEGLKFAGIDIVNLANNHIMDQGQEGLGFTKNKLSENGIKYCGDDEIVFKEIRGTKFAFLGFNFLPPEYNIDLVLANVKKAKRSADVVVVAAHFGNEYTYYPSLRQRKIARKLVDAGADLIIGNHPHYVQGIEYYKDKFIAYSHGNFIFDQVWSEETRAGVVGKYIFYNDSLVGVSFFPVEISNGGQPRITKDDSVIKQMERSTQWIRSKLTAADGHIMDK